MTKSILRDGFDEFELTYSEDHNKIYFESEKRFRMVPKGRRTGFTHSALNYVADIGVDPSILHYKFPGANGYKILWVDTVNGNIQRYVERYLLPALKPLKKECYKWRQVQKELQIFNTTVDFRSADRPETIEGFGYHLIILNEAGIILKGERGRYLWENALLPMISDFGALVLVGGTPKGKSDKKTGKETLYFKLCNRGESNFEKDKDFETIRMIPENSPFLSQKDVALLREELVGAVGKQELDGLFVDIGSEEIFRREWFEIIEDNEIPERYQDIFASWDTAFEDGEENDYSAVTVFGVTQNTIDILFFWKGQVTFPDLKSKFDEVASNPSRFKPWKSIIEKKASGHSLIQEIKENSLHPVEAFNPGTRDKIARANSVTPYFKDKKVRFIRREWTSELMNDLANFPESGRDSTDTISQGLCYIRETKATTTSSSSIKSRSFRARSAVEN